MTLDEAKEFLSNPGNAILDPEKAKKAIEILSSDWAKRP